MATKGPASLNTEPTNKLHNVLCVAGAFVVAAAGGGVWHFFDLPLPWLVGSLYAIAIARIAGLPLLPPPAARQGGQWIIGVGMGLYFTSAVVAEVISHASLIIGMALLSLIMGMLGATVMLRLRQADLSTAFFSSMPGGASEMANLSDIWSASVDLVAAAHATRVMLVVLVVPLALAITGNHGEGMTLVATRPVAWQYFPLMIGASLCGVAIFKLCRLPNTWVLGTLSAIAILAVQGLPLSGLPDWLSATGQLLIGISLGCRFGPGFLRKAPTFLVGILVISLFFLVATATLAFLLAGPTHLAFPSLVLSFAPGGIAEMSITASHLNLEVPLVVASHVVRTAMLTLMAPLGFRMFRWLNHAG